MTIKSKLLSREELERIAFAWHGTSTVEKLLSHIAAIDQQIAALEKALTAEAQAHLQTRAAKDAEIGRLSAFVDRVAFASISEVSRDLREEARLSLTSQPHKNN